MTDKEKQELAEKVGHALGLGRKIRKLAEDRVVEVLKMRQKNEGADAAEWVTVHPNGPENKGQPCLVDKIANIVLGGLGGKFTGMGLGKAFKKAAGKIFKKSKSKKQPHEAASKKNDSSSKSPKEPQEGKNKPNKASEGFDLDKVKQVGNKTPLPPGVKGWHGREKSGLPKIGDGRSAYHDLNKFDESSATGAASKREFAHYTGHLARNLNGALRKDPSLKNDDALRRSADLMDAYFNDPKHRLKNEIKVYRGMGDAKVAREMMQKGVFQDNAYVSTTTSESIVQEFMDNSREKDRFVFAMSVPKGYRAVSLKNNSGHPEEQEILLKRGVHGKITHVEKISNDRGGWDYVGYVKVDPNY